MSSNRMAALALAALMACMPMEAFAEATPSEAEATQTPDAAETPENTETPEETPTPAPDQGPEATLLPQETPRPVETQLPEPEETEDWKPWGQAWAELADGTHTAGSLTEVLAWLENALAEDENATVYIRVSDEITAENVAQRLFERVSFEADGDVFDVDNQDYVVLVDSDDVQTLELDGEEEEDIRFSIRVQVQRKDAQNAKPEKPTETEAPAETEAPGRDGSARRDGSAC